MNRMHAILQKIRLASRGLFLTELAVYAMFVLAYYFLVLHFLGTRMKLVYDENRIHYAILALALIVVQGTFLEILTNALLRVIRRKAR